jgi:pyruvate dehydrogenase E2 component (dihydrolipoamide acetyltransferase)
MAGETRRHGPSRGDVVAVVETQKGAIEIEIFEDGVRARQARSRCLRPGAGAGAGGPEPEPTPESEPALAETVAAPAPPPPPAAPDGALRVSPAARQLAAEKGIDIAALKGSGPGGAILLSDVENAAPGKPAKTGAPGKKASPMEEMRKAIAAAMTRAKRTIPHFYLTETIDVDPAIAFLDAHNETAPPDERILLGAVLVRAATLAAAKVKEMNGHYSTKRASSRPTW